MSKLTLDDIADVRAYESERGAFMAEIIALKKRRRISLGPIVTLMFENRDTIRFQVQEMARVEKLATDAAIENELEVYNPLIPGPGRLSATLFLELTSDAQLKEWLPKLVGIERSIEFRFADGTVVSSGVDPAHEAQLTREETTAAVHYVDFALDAAAVDSLAAGGARLAVNHVEYEHEQTLSEETVKEFLGDLEAG